MERKPVEGRLTRSLTIDERTKGNVFSIASEPERSTFLG